MKLLSVRLFRKLSTNILIFDHATADRQVQIVELDGLQLLLPLTQSKDTEVQRLAAHALANLSVNCKLCISMKDR
jgi:hypothetical protein